MSIQYISICFVLLFSVNVPAEGQNISSPERICGHWESIDKRLIITISMHHDEFNAVIDWFSDTDGKPLDYWTDRHNPDPALRNRKIHGLSILRDLTYDSDSNSWEDGMVYDSKHGKEWNASAYIGKKGLLHVRGYWHFKFIGRTMTFKRI